jgi:sugar/nucleoside kinase (ribokinase family)
LAEHPDVIGLGASTLDVISLVEKFPSREDVQETGDMILQGGGPIATALVTLSRLGLNTAMLDTLGDDWPGQYILSEFEEERVSTQYIRVISGQSSPVSTILVRENGDRFILFRRGSVPDLSPVDLPEELFKNAKILHLNGRHWEACLKACQMAQKYGVLISFDGGAGRYRDKLKEIIKLTDVCIVAKDFAEEHSKDTRVEHAAQALLDQGPSIVVITEGIKGSWIYTRNEDRFHQPAYEIQNVVDTTGAGDVYHGAFLFGYLQEGDLRSAAKIASAAAALKCQSLGGRTGIPRLSELKSFIMDIESGG